MVGDSTFYLHDVTNNIEHYDIDFVTKTRERYGGDTICTITMTRRFRDFQGIETASTLDVYWNSSAIFRGELLTISTSDTGNLTITLENKALKDLKTKFPRGWFNGGGKTVDTDNPYADFLGAGGSPDYYKWVIWIDAAEYADQVNLGAQQASEAATDSGDPKIVLRPFDIFWGLFMAYGFGFPTINANNADNRNIQVMEFDGTRNLFDIISSLADSLGDPVSFGYLNNSTTFFFRDEGTGTTRTFRGVQSGTTPFVEAGSINEARDHSAIINSVQIVGGTDGLTRPFTYYASSGSSAGRHKVFYLPFVTDFTTAEALAAGFLTYNGSARVSHSFTVANAPDILPYDVIKIQTITETIATEMPASITFEYKSGVRTAKLSTGIARRSMEQMISEMGKKVAAENLLRGNDTVGTELSNSAQHFKVTADDGGSSYSLKMLDGDGTTTYSDPESRYTYNGVSVASGHGDSLAVDQIVRGILTRTRTGLNIIIDNAVMVDF